MDYSYLDLSHIDSVLEIERESNPFPWTERNFTDCLEKGYYSLALEDNERLIGFAIMAISSEESHLLNICLLYTSPSPRDGSISRMPSSA